MYSWRSFRLMTERRIELRREEKQELSATKQARHDHDHDPIIRSQIPDPTSSISHTVTHHTVHSTQVHSVGYSVVRTCVCDGAYNRIVILYGYGRYVYMCCKIWMVMRPLRKIYNERYEIVRLNLCSRLLHV